MTCRNTSTENRDISACLGRARGFDQRPQQNHKRRDLNTVRSPCQHANRSSFAASRASLSGVPRRLSMIGAAFAVKTECATVPAHASSSGIITAEEPPVKYAVIVVANTNRTAEMPAAG